MTPNRGDTTAPALVLLNPRAAGGRAGRLVDPIRRWLSAHAADVRLAAPDGIDAARRLVLQQPRGSRIVLVGGDGSVHQLLPAIVEQGGPLALVPCGSGNDTARALGIAGWRWDRALPHALHGASRAVDLAVLHSGGRTTLVASNLAAGFDAAVALRALRGPAMLRGLPRYLWATFGELAALRAWRLQLSVDGRIVHEGDTLLASVLNTPTYGSGMPVVPGARFDDGRLDLIVAGRFGRLGTTLMLPRLLTGTHLGHPRIATHRFTSFQAQADAVVPLAADGEAVPAASSWRVDVRPAALQAVVALPA